MPLKKSVGNMYPWVTHTHSHLGGKCQHECKYCYVQTGRCKGLARYQGEVRLIEKEFDVNYGKGKTIFIEHMNDIFGPGVTPTMIDRILEHCRAWPENTYVFQSKYPMGFHWIDKAMPEGAIIGTTIETNRDIPGVSNAPAPLFRFQEMVMFDWPRKFVTIEPVLDFDVDILAGWIMQINPEFLNLGADSKNNDLPEPTVEKVMALTEKLHEHGIELREKHNLERLKAK